MLTRVQFSVSRIGFTNWYGGFSGVSGNLRIDPKNVTASKLEISIPTASVSTTNSILDGELKSADGFDATKYPTIRFVSMAVKRTGPDTTDITDDLTFHASSGLLSSLPASTVPASNRSTRSIRRVLVAPQRSNVPIGA